MFTDCRACLVELREEKWHSLNKLRGSRSIGWDDRSLCQRKLDSGVAVAVGDGAAAVAKLGDVLVWVAVVVGCVTVAMLADEAVGAGVGDGRRAAIGADFGRHRRVGTVGVDQVVGAFAVDHRCNAVAAIIVEVFGRAVVG